MSDTEKTATGANAMIGYPKSSAKQCALEPVRHRLLEFALDAGDLGPRQIHHPSDAMASPIGIPYGGRPAL